MLARAALEEEEYLQTLWSGAMWNLFLSWERWDHFLFGMQPKSSFLLLTMDKEMLATVLVGTFMIATALGAVLLKRHQGYIYSEKQCEQQGQAALCSLLPGASCICSDYPFHIKNSLQAIHDSQLSVYYNCLKFYDAKRCYQYHPDCMWPKERTEQCPPSWLSE